MSLFHEGKIADQDSFPIYFGADALAALRRERCRLTRAQSSPQSVLNDGASDRMFAAHLGRSDEAQELVLIDVKGHDIGDGRFSSGQRA